MTNIDTYSLSSCDLASGDTGIDDQSTGNPAFAASRSLSKPLACLKNSLASFNSPCCLASNAACLNCFCLANRISTCLSA